MTKAPRRDLARLRAFLLSHPYIWYTKEELRKNLGLPVGVDITPRLRDLRKVRYGATRSYIWVAATLIQTRGNEGMVIHTRRIDGYYRYQYVPPGGLVNL